MVGNSLYGGGNETFDLNQKEIAHGGTVLNNEGRKWEWGGPQQTEV